MSLNFLSHPFYRAFSFSIMARFFPVRNLFAPLVTANSHFPCTAVAIVTIVWRGNEGRPKGRCPLTPPEALPLDSARENETGRSPLP